MRGAGNQVGVQETIMECPYRTTSVKCVSKEGTLYALNAEHFMKRVRDTNPSLMMAAIERLNLVEAAITNFMKVKNAKLHPNF